MPQHHSGFYGKQHSTKSIKMIAPKKDAFPVNMKAIIQNRNNLTCFFNILQDGTLVSKQDFQERV